RFESYLHHITLAHRDLAFDLLERCPEELREWEWHYLMRLCRVEPLVIQNTTEANGVAFSQDGEQIASAGGRRSGKVLTSRTGDRRQSFQAHSHSGLHLSLPP